MYAVPGVNLRVPSITTDVRLGWKRFVEVYQATTPLGWLLQASMFT